MLKIYKKVVVIDRGSSDPRLEAPQQDKPLSRRLLDLLMLPAMIGGALVGVLVFSALFALLLIPVAIFGFRSWRVWRKAQSRRFDDSLEAEYTIVSEKPSQDKTNK